MMTKPWSGAAPPEAPVSVTLPYRVAKTVLEAIAREGHLVSKRFEGRDRERRLRALADASRVLGDALGAPPHRRFVYPPDAAP